MLAANIEWGAGMGTVKHLESLCCLGLPLNGAMIALAMLTNLAAGALGGILIPHCFTGFSLTRRCSPAPSSRRSSFLGIATVWAGLE